jgi:hypothetical protein
MYAGNGMVEDVYINTGFESHYTQNWLHIIKVHSKLSTICENTKVYSTVSKFLYVTFVF